MVLVVTILYSEQNLRNPSHYNYNWPILSHCWSKAFHCSHPSSPHYAFSLLYNNNSRHLRPTPVRGINYGVTQYVIDFRNQYEFEIKCIGGNFTQRYLTPCRYTLRTRQHALVSQQSVQTTSDSIHEYIFITYANLQATHLLKPTYY